ncbi:divergent polysaccharide deacetylase family protein [Dissulfurimicrobium hydrothermale]|uniref:divergent polysaccharide deacetylase family protein n=1 Tax=Dissulfurimicrobium hydrothermale TaxID=1750598 RepID=UPI001EDB9574|nr:divergent polysaccharide deacetylase family protein [Dissulfurimicrobium hydrothermale]UKL12953.1 divergent polysaccharide deacetylase family protein [Dissulfurimicrobium hydrothermale]
MTGTKPRPSKRPTKNRLWHSMSVVFILAVIAIIAALVVFIYLLPAPEVKGPQHQGQQPLRPLLEEPGIIVPPSSIQTKPPQVRPSQPAIPPAKPGPLAKTRGREARHPLPQKERPEIAILIDDMGYNLAIDDALLSLDAPISFAFLPLAPHTARLAKKASQMGRDVLVHLPLEPLDPHIDPGPGALKVDMSPDVMLMMLKKDLDAVPEAIGVNNHMGSRFTADRQAMEVIMPEIKRRGLFFVDSKTNNKSVAYSVAREMGVPSAARSVFLDHNQDPLLIKMELNKAVRLAKHGRGVIVIGHPLPNTKKVLCEELPMLKKEVKLAPIHALVRTD